MGVASAILLSRSVSRIGVCDASGTSLAFILRTGMLAEASSSVEESLGESSCAVGRLAGETSKPFAAAILSFCVVSLVFQAVSSCGVGNAAGAISRAGTDVLEEVVFDESEMSFAAQQA